MRDEGGATAGATERALRSVEISGRLFEQIGDDSGQIIA